MARALSACLLAVAASIPLAATAAPNWITSWTASPQGPYPSGSTVAQPTLQFAFPGNVAMDQTFRLIVRPGLWSGSMRVHFTNLFGNQPVTFDGVHVGLQKTGAGLVSGSNTPVSFGGASSVTLQPGASVWSDPVTLSFVHADSGDRINLAGRKLAVSFHTVGSTGPMTWHATSMTTSYATNPGAGSVGNTEGDVFPVSTTSWYFIDKIDMDAPAGTQLVVAVGDSITDGASSTINGDDRWSDVVARRLKATYGDRVVLINASLSGNRIVGPATYDPGNPATSGPSLFQRLARDVIGLSGVSTVVLQEGTYDVTSGATTQQIKDGIVSIVQQLRLSIPNVRVVGTTLTSALTATGAAGTVAAAAQRIELNQFIQTSGLFDSVVDFYALTTDPQTGALRTKFVPNSAIGGNGDRVNPNRAGALTMGNAVNLGSLVH